MLGNEVHFACFSGTVNTYLVTKEMITVFEEDGISLTLFRTPASDKRFVE